jgi:hypothetical protein
MGWLPSDLTRQAAEDSQKLTALSKMVYNPGKPLKSPRLSQSNETRNGVAAIKKQQRHSL